MARYTGPACRLCRRLSEKLLLKGERCFGPKCAVERRGNPPGQRKGRRRKLSDYGLQLREKQKARYIYGVLERQFRKHFAEAERRPGLTGDNLLLVLELRLDNVAYRLGFGDSRAQARQVVRHGHITLNGRKTDIPSCQIKAGDVIGWRAGSTKLNCYKKVAREIQGKTIPRWLSLDMQKLEGRVLAAPERPDIDNTIREQAIVEFYSR